MTLRSDVIPVTGDPDALYALSLEQQWGDGAPIIPPTDARVEAMLAATPHAGADMLVEDLPPRHGMATVELVAINAVMAGCEPRAFPLVLAALEAIAMPSFNGFAAATTTSSTTPMVIVNGPSREALGIDYRAGCLGGAGGRGSVTIGRAVALCLRNIGGLRAGDSSRTVFGQPARFGLCFGEWEERMDWPSLAVRRGFRPDDEVVTVLGGLGTVPVCDVSTEDDRDLAYLIAKSIALPMQNHFVAGPGTPGEVVLLLNPIWAGRLAKTFPRIESLQDWLYENAWQPIDLWPAPLQTRLRERGWVDGRGRIHAVARPDRIVPVVCGGLGNLHGTVIPCFSHSEMQSVAAQRSG